MKAGEGHLTYIYNHSGVYCGLYESLRYVQKMLDAEESRSKGQSQGMRQTLGTKVNNDSRQTAVMRLGTGAKQRVLGCTVYRVRP